MMRMKTGTTSGMPPPPPLKGGGRDGGGGGGEGEWEMRPGGMLVQKRTDADQNRAPPPTIRVRVKYGSIYHQINISSQATFGELKKMLSGPTGLHHEDQKLIYKNKERDSKAFLDFAGVKDKSKIVLVEDPISQEKRYIEMRKNAMMEKAAKTISGISLEVDRLAGEVAALESVISKGGRVAEKDLVNLIELLMNQLLNLDGITADGDVKLQRKMQVRRVQKCVETLDVLKIKNAMPKANGNHIPAQQPSPTLQHQQQRDSNEQVPSPSQQQQARYSVRSSPAQGQTLQQSRRSNSGDVVITTQWETFDSTPSRLPTPPATSTNASSTASSPQPRFDWDLLL